MVVSMDRWQRIEASRKEQQHTFDQLRSQSERNKLGQFATPFPLAREIVSIARSYQSITAKEVRFLEPAVGLGALYSALLAESAPELPESAVAYEVDAKVVEIANELWQSSALKLKLEDFTQAQAPVSEADKFNLIVANPPYVRHQHLSRQDKQRLGLLATRVLGFRPSGLMGLYGYFLLAAHAWLQEDAISAWLIPTEFMDVGYGYALKQYLTNNVELIRVHRFEADNVQFDGVYVTSTVLFFRNQRPSPGHEALFTYGVSLEKPTRNFPISVQKLNNLRKWTSVGQRRPTVKRQNGSTIETVTIGDLFEVKRGIVTGANKFFIIPAEEANRRALPGELLRPLLPSPRYLKDMTVIDDNDSGLPEVDPQLFLLDCRVPPKELAVNYPTVYQYIQEGEQRGLPDRYLLSRRDPWYRQEERDPAPIVCSYMGRKKADGSSVRFIRNRSKAIATNVYLLLYPKPAVKQLCLESDAIIDQIFALLLALDQTEIVYQGRTYGGGLDKVEPNELQRVVLGAPEKVRLFVPELNAIMESARTKDAAQLALPFGF